MTVKRYVTFAIALVLGFVITFAMSSSQPAQAQEDLDTILARAAARSFLTSLTRPELAGTVDFYTAETLRTDNVLAELGNVTSYQITSADWLKPNETYQVKAILYPGGQEIVINTSKYKSRWQVDGLELPATATVAQTNTPAAPTTEIQPVEGNGTGKLVFQTQSGGGIYVINADGTGLTYVTNGMDPQLSPDGNQIVFTRWDPRYELFTINIDGTNERAWFHGKREMKSATWSADGKNLVFSFQDGGRLEGDLEKYSFDRLRRMAENGEKPYIPKTAKLEIKDYRLFVYIPADAHWWLAEVNMENGAYEDLGTGSRYNFAASWHPNDPNKLFYRTDHGIGMYNADSKTSQPVSHDDRDRGGLAASPDGSKLAFTYNQDGNWEIHTINLDGTNRQRLTETPLYAIASKNNDGNDVYINEEGFRTMSRAQGDGQTDNRWNNASPAWSPDSSQIAFVTDRTGQWEIWIMNADGSNQRPMFPNGALDGIELDFAGVDERMLSWR
ncbi:MAG: PD40 domain-containing protein [Anaerolineae bacterium]|nr:PD40 domain-containing protein [Anaerolineae bacterium]